MALEKHKVNAYMLKTSEVFGKDIHFIKAADDIWTRTFSPFKQNCKR